eukprot:Opistho-1_new@45815
MPTTPCWSARVRAAPVWSGLNCWPSTARSSLPRARRSTLWPAATSRCWSSAIRPTPMPTSMKSAPDLPRKNFTAMLRLDHNRAASQLAAKTGKAVADIEKLTVWGNHSPPMYSALI